MKPVTGVGIINSAEAIWCRSLRRIYPNVAFYEEVRVDSSVTIAYDGKTGERYGELPKPKVTKR